jgi:hypothetical protein
VEPAFEEAAFEEPSAEEPETLEPEPEPAPVASKPDDADAEGGDWGYVPMSEWGDDLKPSR